jgi:hypothetical protein
MARVSYAMAQAMKAGAPLILLAAIEHPNNTGYFWSGIGSLQWNGQTWAGAGKLGSIAPIEHTTNLSIQEILFTLVGADPEIVATLSDDVRNKSGQVWLACLDEMGGVVTDPIQIVDSQLDYQSFKIDDDGTSTLQITARTGFFILETPLHDVWSDEDQRAKYPTDSGLSLISGLQNQDLVWGRAA